MTKQLISSGGKWESIVGYSRAIIMGNTIEFAGTTAALGGEILFPGNAAGQARYIFELFSQVLEEHDFSLKDIVRTRMYLTHMEDWKDVGKVHGEFFSDIKPVSTLLGIQALVDPQMRIEIEATAIKA